MRINGLWVGWGLGDWSHYPDGTDRDPTVRQFKAFARRMYRSYMGQLADTNVFDPQLYDAFVIMQDKLVAGGLLVPGRFVRGVLDLETSYASGFKRRPDAPKPIIFTVEGHMSNMFFGPCAATASFLEGQGVCHWKPIGYLSNDVPFNNKSGVNELVSQLSKTSIEGPPGVFWPFPSGTPWGIIIFSQGGIVGSQFMMRHVLPDTGSLHWRLKDFKRGLAFGNPYRENNKCCSWAKSPTDANTQGISDELFNTSTTPIASKWAEHPAHKDLFAENTADSAGRDKTAIYKIIAENSWIGGPASIFSRVLMMFGNPVGEGFAAIKAAYDGIMFLASNPNPHYTTVSEPGDVEFMRGVAL